MSDTQKPVVVIGEGWAALGAVASLIRSQAWANQENKTNQKIIWVAGTGTKIRSPLPTLDATTESEGESGSPSVALSQWLALARFFCESDLVGESELETGSFLREFRNKAFREPLWTKAPTLENRRETLKEILWSVEQNMAPLFEARFQLTLGEIEDAMRAALLADGAYPHLHRIEGVPIEGFRFEPLVGKGHHEKITGVLLGSGQILETETVIYADRWSELVGMQGLPKGLPFLRNREAMGVLQATLGHSPAIGTALREGFFLPLHKEAGETVDRHVWGYFSTDGTRSFWTLALSPEEVEDNHQIAKKLRRMKSALEKAFAGDPWPDEFSKTVISEQVCFEESFFFSEGDVVRQPVALAKNQGVYFLTDGYGPSAAFAQVGALAELLHLVKGSQAETKGVDLTDPSAP